MLSLLLLVVTFILGMLCGALGIVLDDVRPVKTSSGDTASGTGTATASNPVRARFPVE
jgi:hypothetical protein